MLQSGECCLREREWEVFLVDVAEQRGNGAIALKLPSLTEPKLPSLKDPRADRATVGDEGFALRCEMHHPDSTERGASPCPSEDIELWPLKFLVEAVLVADISAEESPGMVETDQSFHTDGTGRAFSSFNVETFLTPERSERPEADPRMRGGADKLRLRTAKDAKVDAFGSGKLPSLLLSSLHPVSRTGYGGQVQLLVSGLSKDFHIQLLAWNLKHRGEGPAEDLEALLQGKGINKTEALTHAGGDPRALLPGVPVVTSQLAPPTGHEKGQGWLEILRAVDLFSASCDGATDCRFQKPDVILHLHDAWWLGPPPAQIKEAVKNGRLPPMVSWLPILFDPLLSDDPERPDRSGAALEVFSGVVSMSLWGRGVYERALASLAAVLNAGSADGKQTTVRWLPPLLGHIPHALHPAFAEGPLAFESDTRRHLRQMFRLPEAAFVVLLVGRNPPPPSSEANRKSHRTAIRAFARFRQQVDKLCEDSSGSAGTPSVAARCAHAAATHLHVHSDLHGAVDIQSLLKDAGLSLENGAASASREHLSPEMLRNLYSASDVLLQLSRAEGFGLPVIEAQACGTPVIVNGATAMAENVFLGKVLLPTPRQSPSGGRNDRPGSWTPPDGAAAVEALLEIWSSPPTATERNRARVALQSFFAPSFVSRQMAEVLHPLVPKEGLVQHKSVAPLTEVSDRVAGAAFCQTEFEEVELQCWKSEKTPSLLSWCEELEASLRKCFTRNWEQPTLAPGFEGVHRLITTPFGSILYNVYDIAVGRTLELCRDWLAEEKSIYTMLQPLLAEAPVRMLEVGANIGALTIPLAMQMPHGRVLALEPSQMNLKLLNANIALAQLSNVDTFQGALGESQGSIQVEEPGQRTFHNSRLLGTEKSWRGQAGQASADSLKSVPVVTADQLLSQVDRLDFLRFGSSSISIPAILGAAKSLQRFRPWLLAELSLDPSEWILDADEKEQQIRQALERNHYQCSSSVKISALQPAAVDLWAPRAHADQRRKPVTMGSCEAKMSLHRLSDALRCFKRCSDRRHFLQLFLRTSPYFIFNSKQFVKAARYARHVASPSVEFEFSGPLRGTK
eukprot:Skav218884  [mRNA]  locus=scaffold2503:146893:153872:+ [translate_table: standard]